MTTLWPTYEHPGLAGCPFAAVETWVMCSCGRGHHRKDQRNCHVCHREAQTRYREKVPRGTYSHQAER